MKTVAVFKRTLDEWCPSYKVVYDNGQVDMFVEVSFMKLHPSNEWRVCVWGYDDCGMEKDFPPENENEAWNTFLIIIGWHYVNMQHLSKLGFVGA